MTPHITVEAAARRLAEGLPLLSFSELALNWHELWRLAARVVVIFAEYQDLTGELPHTLQASSIDSLLGNESIEAWYDRKPLPIKLLPADPAEELVWEAVIHAAVKPFIVHQAKVLRELIDQDRWRRGHCPVCGGIPDFSFLDSQNGARWLVCSRCDTEWLFQRMQCPFCSNEDQNTLAYFTDDRGVYRLYICERCRRYLKAIDLRAASTGADPLLERILTPDLDREANARGYHPGWATTES